MTRLRPLPFRKAKKALRSLGFEAVRQKGSHVHFRHPDGRIVQVPNHPGEDIGRGLVAEIIKAAGVSRAEFYRRV